MTDDGTLPEAIALPPPPPAIEPHDRLEEGDEPPPRGARMMALVRWALVAAMAGAALFALDSHFGWSGAASSGDSGATYYCPMHPGVQQDHPGDCPICNMSLVPMEGGDPSAATAADTGTYYCPMHPEVTSTDPHATCEPCGGMQLVPMPPGITGDGGVASDGVPGLVPIDLTQDRIQLIGMRTESVTSQALASELSASGVVVASERGLASVQTRFAGWIEDLFVEQTGEKIKRGQVVATVYSPELLGAQEEYLAALRWAQAGAGGGTTTATTDALARDARARLEVLGISRQEIDQIAKTGKPLRTIKIRSSAGGTVIERGVVQGDYVQPGTPLLQIADLSKVWVVAEIYEHEVGRVKIGQAARVELPAYPGESFTGEVSFIHPSLDPTTRTLRARVEVANKDLRLKPGMYGTVLLAVDSAEALVISVEALVDTGAVQYVFVAKEGGRFEPRPVTVGARADGKVAVLAGLVAGEIVVTTGNFLLDSESRLRATIEGAPAAPGQAAIPDFCDDSFDRAKYPDKYDQCKQCKAHRGMGTMEDDCRAAISKPWK